MSANDCCGMLISCCMCCSVCNHSSDSSCIRWLVNFFPAGWCNKLDGEDVGGAERDHEADLFFHGQTTAQPGSLPAMSEKAGGMGVRDKSQILPTPEDVARPRSQLESRTEQPDSVPPLTDHEKTDRPGSGVQ